MTRLAYRFLWFALAAAFLPLATLSAAPPKPNDWVVHEWGTFTSLQDETGAAIAGVNVDDEPVPPFVHNLAQGLLQPEFIRSSNWLYRSKGAPPRHPQVTMRLETPVIYFYPPEGATLPAKWDVHVRFRGGWLSEFYPQAVVTAPGVKTNGRPFASLTSKTEGTLAWNDLQVGTSFSGPQTTEPVWTAPRKVNAVNVTSQGESEKYLFYRGIGHLDAPLRVSTDLKTGELAIRANFQEVLAAGDKANISRLWLVHIRADGTSAYRPLEGFDVTSDSQKVHRTTAGDFEPKQFAAGNLAKLKEEMQKELVAQGLYADEATALLATWDRAYFQSPGLRIFCVTPRVWTDHYLPLTLSRQARVERVLIARIELINREQRAILDKMRSMPASDPRWVLQLEDDQVRDRILAGRMVEVQGNVKMPADFRLFLELGRFRNALILHSEKTNPKGGALTAFVDYYGLDMYRFDPVEEDEPEPRR